MDSTNGQLITKEIFKDEDREPLGGAVGLFGWLAGSGAIVPGWWSTARDARLRALWKEEDHLAGTVVTLREMMTAVPFSVQPRDRSVRSHVAQAERFTDILLSASESRSSLADRGWDSCYGAFIQDYHTQDNGAFWAIEGPGKPDGPLTGEPTKLIHLDSYRCQRTRSREFPVIYQDDDGRRYKLHHTRVIVMTGAADASQEMLGVGLCSVSRAIYTAQHLKDIATYKMEKLGSRPRRAIMFIPGAGNQDVKAIEGVLNQADVMMNNAGLARYAPVPIVGLRAGADQPQLLDLASLPDGFNELESTQLGMAVLALAFGVDSRQLAFALGVSGVTKADAEVQHAKMRGKGPGYILQATERRLNAKFLPPHLTLKFDYQDDEQDDQVAKIRERRAVRRQIDLGTSAINLRVAREQMLEDGDLNQSQFEQLELSDGRLPNGQPVLTLFNSNEAEIARLLNLGVAEPLDVALNDAEMILEAIDRQTLIAQERSLNAYTSRLKSQAQQAVAALTALRELYEKAHNAGATSDTSDGVEAAQSDMLGVVGEENDEAAAGELGGQGGGPDQESPFSLKSLGAYQAGIRASVRGLHSGTLSRKEFTTGLKQIIDRQLRDAWREGAAECGIAPDEMTEGEQFQLVSLIKSQFGYIAGFADAIIQSKKDDGPIDSLLSRAGMWINRYGEVRSLAMQLACKDQKLEWIIDPAKESCADCLKYAGRVYRASTWQSAGLAPKSAGLACGGFRCGCRFEKTTKRMTRGKPPRLSGG